MTTFGSHAGPGSTASARQRAVAAVVTATLLLAQVLTVFHFIIVPHSISPTTGKLVHCREPHSHDRHSDGGDQPYREDPEDECQVFAVMQQAAVLPGAAVGVVAALVESGQSSLLSAEELTLSHRGLHRLAPSRSPPASQA